MQLSAFDIKHVVSTLSHLTGAKIEKIFAKPKPDDEFLFALHVPGSGKSFFYVHLPGLCCEVDFKPDFPQVPPAFAASLRRKINNARIDAVEQVGFDRIIKIVCRQKDRMSHLYIELFAPGNIILCDENDVILSALYYKKWQGRSILAGQPYVLPPTQTNPFELSFESFCELLSSTETSSLVKCLAIDCSLGGVFAQEVIARCGVDKDLAPARLDASLQKQVFDALTSLLQEPTAPHEFKNTISPVKLSEATALSDSFHQALAQKILSFKQKEEHQEFKKSSTKNLSKYEKIIFAQEKQLEQVSAASKELHAVGEKIYEHYIPLEKILSRLQEDLESLSSQEFLEKYKNDKLVKSINLKDKKVTLEVPE